MAKKSAYDEARDLFGRVGAGAQGLYNQAHSFVQQNPAPINVITNPIQQKIQQFGQNYPRATSFLTQRVEPQVQRVSSFLQQPYKPVTLPQAQVQAPPSAPYAATIPARVGAGTYNYLVKPMAEGLINAPANYIGGITRTGLDLGRIGRGEQVPVKQTLADVASVAKGIMDVAIFPGAMGVAKQAIGSVGARTFGSVVKEGAKTGAGFGGLYGGAQALIDNKDVQNTFNYLTNVFTGTAGGVVGGAAIGGGVAGGSYVAGKVIGTVYSFFRSKGLSDQSAMAKTVRYVRDEFGQFAKEAKGKIKETPSELKRRLDAIVLNDMYGNRTTIGEWYKKNGQAGFADFGAKIGGIKNIKPTLPTEAVSGVKTAGTEGGARGVATATTPQIMRRPGMPPQGNRLPEGNILNIGQKLNVSEETKGVLPKGKAQQISTGLKQPISTSLEGRSPSSKIITQVVNPTDPYFNVNRLNVKPEVRQAVKTAVEQSKPQIEKMVGKTLSGKEVIETANRTANVLHKAVTRDETLKWESAMLKARQTLADQAQSGTVTQEFIDALLTVKTQGTDIARKLQSLSIGADPQRVTAKQIMLESVLKQTDKADEVIKAAQGVDFNNFQQATEFYRRFIKPTKEEWMDTLRYNSMLSSPNTHINNIASNYQGTGIIAPIEKTLTGVFDWMRSPITGKRQYFAGEGVEYTKGYYTNLGKAAKRFGEVFSGNAMGDYPELRDIPLATKGVKQVAEDFLKVPQRALEAMDQFFTVLTSEGTKRSLEYKASKGAKVGDIAKEAASEAQVRLFRGDFGRKEEGPVLRAWEYIPQKIMEAKNSANPVVRLTAKLSFPFVRIAVNLFKQGIEYSPSGVSTIPGAKEKLPQFTKAFMGAMVGVGATMLATSNRITWAKPSSQKQRELWDQGGMQEYSVKVGDKWVSYSKLHPLLAFNLATVAGVKQALEKQSIDDNTGETILTSLGNIMRFYADQSYVKNIGDFIQAAEGGVSSFPKIASNYAQQFVPYRAFMGWLARTLDPLQRTTTQDAGAIQKQMEYFFMQIPGLRQSLPAKTGTTGEPIENKNRFINAISPARITTGNEKYRQAYEIQKNLPKAQEAKKEAIKLFIQGQDDKVKDMLRQYKMRIESDDIKSYQKSQLKKAADLFIENKDGEAKQILQEAKVQLSDVEVKKAAKRKAVELYKLGLDDEVKKILQRYGIILTTKDVQ